MMNDIFTKFKKVIPEETINNLVDLSVFRDTDGSYHLFDKYVIRRVKDEYIVSVNSFDTNKTFYTLKHAVAWCTYDKRNKIVDSNRIYDLDKKVAGLESIIQGHQKLIKSTKNMDDKLIYLAKLGEEKMKKRQLYDELGRYIATSKSWQNNRFNTKPV
jgi:hypothetical protein